MYLIGKGNRVHEVKCVGPKLPFDTYKRLSLLVTLEKVLQYPKNTLRGFMRTGGTKEQVTWVVYEGVIRGGFD
mgnify:FL=1